MMTPGKGGSSKHISISFRVIPLVSMTQAIKTDETKRTAISMLTGLIFSDTVLLQPDPTHFPCSWETHSGPLAPPPLAQKFPIGLK